MLCSCSQPSKQNPSAKPSAVDSLNRQIEDFNGSRHSGVSPINQQITKVRHVPETHSVICFDLGGKQFIVLKQQDDGQFKGIVDVEYHDAAGGDEWSWGTQQVEFKLQKGQF